MTTGKYANQLFKIVTRFLLLLTVLLLVGCGGNSSELTSDGDSTDSSSDNSPAPSVADDPALPVSFSVTTDPALQIGEDGMWTMFIDGVTTAIITWTYPIGNCELIDFYFNNDIFVWTGEEDKTDLEAPGVFNLVKSFTSFFDINLSADGTEMIVTLDFLSLKFGDGTYTIRSRQKFDACLNNPDLPEAGEDWDMRVRFAD